MKQIIYLLSIFFISAYTTLGAQGLVGIKGTATFNNTAVDYIYSLNYQFDTDNNKISHAISLDYINSKANSFGTGISISNLGKFLASVSNIDYYGISYTFKYTVYKGLNLGLNLGAGILYDIEKFEYVVKDFDTNNSDVIHRSVFDDVYKNALSYKTAISISYDIYITNKIIISPIVEYVRFDSFSELEFDHREGTFERYVEEGANIYLEEPAKLTELDKKTLGYSMGLSLQYKL
jgi:hypothetical protein